MPRLIEHPAQAAVRSQGVLAYVTPAEERRILDRPPLFRKYALEALRREVNKLRATQGKEPL